MRQLASWAARMPITNTSWLRLTRRPRQRAGLTSAMYVGEILDASPIATPPKRRQAMKAMKENDHPVPIEEIANNNAAPARAALRPYRSLMRPAISEPKKQPTRAELLAHAIAAGARR